jgi:hypothetical protein
MSTAAVLAPLQSWLLPVSGASSSYHVAAAHRMWNIAPILGLRRQLGRANIYFIYTDDRGEIFPTGGLAFKGGGNLAEEPEGKGAPFGRTMKVTNGWWMSFTPWLRSTRAVHALGHERVTNLPIRARSRPDREVSGACLTEVRRSVVAPGINVKRTGNGGQRSKSYAVQRLCLMDSEAGNLLLASIHPHC